MTQIDRRISSFIETTTCGALVGAVIGARVLPAFTPFTAIPLLPVALGGLIGAGCGAIAAITRIALSLIVHLNDTSTASPEYQTVLPLRDRILTHIRSLGGSIQNGVWAMVPAVIITGCLFGSCFPAFLSLGICGAIAGLSVGIFRTLAEETHEAMQHMHHKGKKIVITPACANCPATGIRI